MGHSQRAALPSPLELYDMDQFTCAPTTVASMRSATR
jgi:hypothetical protein